jgi:proteasome lid subunit RPN8/RPN11
LNAIVAHARGAAPAECCGILVGRGTEVLEAVAARNLSDDPNRFLVDPGDHFTALRAARERSLGVIGFYHSHPHSPAEPSETDLAEASYPDHLYLIVSVRTAPPEVKAFRLDASRFIELRLESY